MNKLSYEELMFLISVLDPNDKRELVKEFSDVFKEMMNQKVISKSWYYELLKGFAPSDKVVYEACVMEPKVEDWVITRAISRAKRVLQIAERLSEVPER